MRNIKRLKRALTRERTNPQFPISNHASLRFRERAEYYIEYLRMNSSREDLEFAEPVYQEFVGYFYEFNLAALFNQANLIELDEKKIERNAKYPNTKIFRVGNFDFIVSDGVVKTIELNGKFRKLNRSRKSLS